MKEIANMEKKHQYIYWSVLNSGNWQLYLAASEQGVCYIGGQHESFDHLVEWMNSRYPQAVLERNDERLQPYTEELTEYLQGDRMSFTMTLDIQGTSFQRAVWRTLCEIPYGETRTYSEIAAYLQKPKAARAVGTAIGANPILITVPCHRVIGKNGHMTGYRGGLDMKKRLLQVEHLYTDQS